MSVSEKCHIIGVMGGKGGVGKSVFAANLACAFYSEIKAPTLLIDLDSRSAGDQNIITGLRPIKTIGEVAQFSGSFNPSSLKSVITQHASGLSFIGAVHSPDQKLSVSPELLKKQIFNLSQYFNYIIVDLGNDPTDVQMSLIEECSTVCLVTTPEVLVVNQTRRLINELMTATLPASMFQIVLNKVSRSGLSPQAISQSLKRPLIGQIPQDDITALSALQRSQPFVLTQPNTPIAKAHHDIVRKLTGGILQKSKAVQKPTGLKVLDPPASSPGKMDSSKAGNAGRRSKAKELDPSTLLKLQIHKGLIKEMDLKKNLTSIQGDEQKELELRQKTQRTITQLIDRLAPQLPRTERSSLIKQVLDEALGLGALEELLADPNVSEIMVNGHNKIFVEKNGKLTLSETTFTSNLQLRNVIERIVAPLGRQINEKTPYVDARLQDGSRVNAVIEPLAIDGPTLTIRKFATEIITPAHYINWGSMTQAMVDFLKICVEQGLNVVISGGTGSGKTTLLNTLSQFIPSNERIITVEDAAELQLQQSHVVRLETRPANMEGSGEISIRDLIKNSLRMRPDRIVVGECRDGAALDMLSAMNTGHDGSMTTVHANNPREGIARLETLCMMAGMDLPVRAIREQIAGAVNLIIQIGRLSDGSRKIKSITEVVGMTGETITLQEVFRFKEEGFDKNRKIIGQFQPMGLIPTFIEKFEKRGVTIPRNLFSPNTKPAAQQNPGAAKSSAPTPIKPKPKPAAPRPAFKKASGGDES